MKELKFRLLKEEEIDARIGSVFKGGYTLLLYKNARVDMQLLDDTVGAFNWQRKHNELKGNLYCSVGIYDDENKQWVWKEDAGAESFSDKEKGEASDSFKRACFNWGIGRELYTAPFIFVEAETEYDAEKRRYVLPKSFKPYFKVDKIDYVASKISELIISNKGQVIFNMKSGFIKAEKQEDKKVEQKVKAIYSGNKCSACDEDISDKVYNYSVGKFGKALCFNCQKQPKTQLEEVEIETEELPF